MKYSFVITIILWGRIIGAQNLTILEKSSLQPISNVIITNEQGTNALTNQFGTVNLDKFKKELPIIIFKTGFLRDTIYLSETYKQDLVHFLTEKIVDLDEIVVSASKFEEKRKDVAKQVQVIQSKELEFISQQTSADVMFQSGNIMVQKSQMGGGSPIIRGFEANKVLIVVDGVRMNNAIYRGGHLQNIITLDNSILEKTEITYGPGSVVYGSDALGGVMHFFTKKPILADSGRNLLTKLSAYNRFSSANKEITNHLDINIANKRFGSLSSLTYSDFNDLRMGGTRSPMLNDWGKSTFYVDRLNNKDTMVTNTNNLIQKFTGYKQLDLLQKFLFKQNNNISHLFNIQYSTTSDIPRYDRLSEITANGQPRSAAWYYGPQNRLFVSYSFSHQGRSIFHNEAKLVIAYQNIEESRHNRNFGSQNLNHRIENVKLWTVNFDLSKKIAHHELRYGLDIAINSVRSSAYRDLINSNKVVALDTRYPNGGSSMNTYAAYLTHSWEISNKLIFTDGLRLSAIRLNSKFTDTSFFKFPFTQANQHSQAINGNLGLIYMPTDDWRMVILGSSGFRAPNVDDMAKVFETAQGTLIVPNAQLRPEYLYSIESSVSKTFDKKIRIDGTVFYSWFVDAITTRKFKYQGKDSIEYDGKKSAIFANVNAKHAFIYGTSISLNAELTKSFSINSTLNYTYGRIKTDSIDYPLDHIAPTFGKIGFLLSIKRLKSECWTQFSGAKNSKDFNLMGEDNQQYSFDTKKGYYPGWYTLNARAAYSINRHLQVQIAVENILDQYYRTFASGLSAPGRNMMITVRVKV